MWSKRFIVLCAFILEIQAEEINEDNNNSNIEIIDMSRATNWKALSEYYSAFEKHWKMCVNCGAPALGTAMHLEHGASASSMHPAVIPSEYLVTRLVVIDVSSLASREDDYVLTLDVALQWPALRHDPREPTLLLFKFGWKDDATGYRLRNCICKIPGIGYDLAQWISLNLTHVVGVATDAPTLESMLTREYATTTISNLLGKSGVFMIENVIIRKKIPEQGCMAIAMPMKLQNTNYVPTRLSAFCPATKTDKHVTLALKKKSYKRQGHSRINDVNLDEILN